MRLNSPVLWVTNVPWLASTVGYQRIVGPIGVPCFSRVARICAEALASGVEAQESVQRRSVARAAFALFGGRPICNTIPLVQHKSPLSQYGQARRGL